MPIAALPRDTAQVISSTLVINDAVSVVKELVDNALDARTDSISVEVSANTLDVIQVKDNGTGIGVEDRQLLCKRGCTSKIRSIEDLASLGGTFLGFRGEALASVGELSGSVTVTTRIDGEIVGSALKFGAAGQLMSCSSASHPVGTTVRIHDFLKTVPVRKQTVLKGAAKAIANIRKMLFSYAFARPEVRFSFKVLKGKNDRANWAYAPSSAKASLSEVVAKIVGKEVAVQCKEHASESADIEEETGWSVEACLVAIESDVQKACNAPQYVSIDGRPVSADRNLIKILGRLYKQYLNHALAKKSNTPPASRPFLYLRIRCPPDTYDVNIEPAKDEVLFLDPNVLRNTFERLLKGVYGETEERSGEKVATQRMSDPKKAKTGSFNLLLARKPPGSTLRTDQDICSNASSSVTDMESDIASDSLVQDRSNTNSQTVQESLQDEEAESPAMEMCKDRSSSAPKTHFNMFAVEHDITELDGSTSQSNNTNAPYIEEDEDINSPSVTNPWSMAKMNARIAPRGVGSGRNLITPEPAAITTPSNRNSNLVQPPGSSHRTPLSRNVQLPAPVASPELSAPYQNPGPPNRRRAPTGDESDRDSNVSSTSERNGVRPNRTSLDAWVKPQSEGNPMPSFQRPGESSKIDRRFGRTSPKGNLFSQRNHPGSESGSLSDDQNPVARSPRIRMPPFKSPIRGRQQDGAHSHFTSSRITPTFIESALPGTPLNTPRGPSGELDEVMDFEHRKKQAMADQRKQAAKGLWSHSGFTPLSTRQQDSSATARAPATSSSIQHSHPNDQTEDPRKNFESRFGGAPPAIPSSPASNTPRSSPHHNRYVAATRYLTPSHSHPHSHPPEPHPPSIPTTENDNSSLRILGSDPRAYLMRHLQRTKENESNTSSLRRVGLKVHRTKTLRLPFETIPAEAATHGLIVGAEVGNAGALMGEALRLGKGDAYVRSGRDECWGMALEGMEVEEIGELEGRVRELVRKGYRARAGLGAPSDGSVEFDLDLNTSLLRAVQAESSSQVDGNVNDLGRRG